MSSFVGSAQAFSSGNCRAQNLPARRVPSLAQARSFGAVAKWAQTKRDTQTLAQAFSWGGNRMSAAAAIKVTAC